MTFGAPPHQNPLQQETQLIPPDALVDSLLRRQLLLVTGKGGVGKSTVAAVLARAAAKQGKRVLLVEFESVSRAAPLFGLPSLGPEPVLVAPQIWAQSLTSMDSLRFFAIQQLKIQALVHLAMRNKAVEGFFRASPAVRPTLFLYQLWRTLEDHGPNGDRRWDLLICDLPTSGFVAGMYAIPGMLTGVFKTGPIANYAEGMRALLHDVKRTGLTLVTLPEEMPVVEALELRTLLHTRHQIEPAAMVLNAVMPHRLDADVVDGLERAADRNPQIAEPWLETAEKLQQRRAKALSAARKLRENLPSNTLLSLPWRFDRELTLPAIDELAVALRTGSLRTGSL